MFEVTTTDFSKATISGPTARARQRAHKLEIAFEHVSAEGRILSIEYNSISQRYELFLDHQTTINVDEIIGQLRSFLDSQRSGIRASLSPINSIIIDFQDTSNLPIQFSEMIVKTQNESSQPGLFFALGITPHGTRVFGDLGGLNHLLVAGKTGSGKSVFLTTLVASLLITTNPSHLQLLIIDVKGLDLTCFAGADHLIRGVITTGEEAHQALSDVRDEISRRSDVLRSCNVRTLSEYNERCPQGALPDIVIVIDDLPELIRFKGISLDRIADVILCGRQNGVHVVAGTAQMDSNLATLKMLSLFPSRVAMPLFSRRASQLIVGCDGAEKLNRGELLYKSLYMQEPVRCDAPSINPGDLESIIRYSTSEKSSEGGAVTK
jgi:S-DNA-T family DNA segregation ATPase FtsK/SpoIIIE